MKYTKIKDEEFNNKQWRKKVNDQFEREIERYERRNIGCGNDDMGERQSVQSQEQAVRGGDPIPRNHEDMGH